MCFFSSDPFKVLGNIPIQLLHGPSARKLWSSAPKKTISFNDWIILSKPFYLTKDVYIQCLRRIDINFNLSDKIIPIYPKETILAHTNEYIGGRNFITTSMQARSTVGRTCLAICKCAGWGDVGYFNRWTMEITNFSNHVILIPANAIIGQIIFQTVSQAKNELLDYVSKGSYQNSSDLQQTILNWKPEMMLPANKLAAAK